MVWSLQAMVRQSENANLNYLAKLAISIARKMNALIFLVPEDIVDVRPRLVSPIDHKSSA